MAHPIKYTKEVLADIRAKSDASYAYFHNSILGNELPTLKHIKQCNELQGIDPDIGEWTRLCRCWSRNFGLKTTIGLRYLLWRGLKDPSWSSLLVERTVDNAIAHLYEKVIQLFESRGYAFSMMRAVYPERIPPGEFWTTKKFSLVQEVPDTPPTIQCMGIDGSYEGKHVNFIMVEDPEGADADKSGSVNEDAQNFIFNRAEPLLKDQATDQICVTLTPHGPDPTAYALRNIEGEGSEMGTLDNSKRKIWKISWQPVLDENGEPFWNKPGTKEWLDGQLELAKRNPKVRESLMANFFLERPESGASFFTSDQVDRNTYEVIAGHMLSYRATDYTLDKATGAIKTRKAQKVCPLRSCWFYIHGDPKHRETPARHGRRSEWAYVVVAVSPDFHRFVIHEWSDGQANSTEGLEKFFELYRWFTPRFWTFDTTGAQVWFIDRMKELEKTKYLGLRSSGRAAWDRKVRAIPRPSSRVVESVSFENKEDRIFDRLSPLMDFDWLHLHASRTPKTRQHLMRVGTGSNEPIDLADALAQGPDVWQPPLSAEARKAIALQRAIMERMRGDALYQTPWRAA